MEEVTERGNALKIQDVIKISEGVWGWELQTATPGRAQGEAARGKINKKSKFIDRSAQSCPLLLQRQREERRGTAEELEISSLFYLQRLWVLPSHTAQRSCSPQNSALCRACETQAQKLPSISSPGCV